MPCIDGSSALRRKLFLTSIKARSSTEVRLKSLLFEPQPGCQLKAFINRLEPILVFSEWSTSPHRQIVLSLRSNISFDKWCAMKLSHLWPLTLEQAFVCKDGLLELTFIRNRGQEEWKPAYEKVAGQVLKESWRKIFLTQPAQDVRWVAPGFSMDVAGSIAAGTIAGALRAEARSVTRK